VVAPVVIGRDDMKKAAIVIADEQRPDSLDAVIEAKQTNAKEGKEWLGSLYEHNRRVPSY
jgi:hypothetical protein